MCIVDVLEQMGGVKFETVSRVVTSTGGVETGVVVIETPAETAGTVTAAVEQSIIE